MVMISLVFSLFWVSLLIGAQATPTLTSKYARSNKIEWTSCQEEGIEGFKCGSLTVPLDYTDPSSDQTLDLQVLKIDATKTPKKGSILFNFGGPGLEARFTLAAQAELFIRYVSVVFFYPRIKNTVQYILVLTEFLVSPAASMIYLPTIHGKCVLRLSCNLSKQQD